MARYLLRNNTSGNVDDVAAITATSGAIDQDKIIATNANGLVDPSFIDPDSVTRQDLFKTRRIAITSQLNLQVTDDYYQFIEPSGTQIVNLPLAVNAPDLSFKIFNISTASSNRINLFEDNLTLSVQLRRGKVAEVISDGIDWFILLIN